MFYTRGYFNDEITNKIRKQFEPKITDAQKVLKTVNEGLSKKLPEGYHTVHIIDTGGRFFVDHIKSHGDDINGAIKHTKYMDTIKKNGVDEKGNFVFKKGSAEKHIVMHHNGKGKFQSVDPKSQKVTGWKTVISED